MALGDSRYRCGALNNDRSLDEKVDSSGSNPSPLGTGTASRGGSGRILVNTGGINGWDQMSR
jgi:hypothetical protein